MPDLLFGVFGLPMADLAMVPADAVQLSPLVPGATVLEDLAHGCLAGMVMAAPPGTVERRYWLAQGLRALAPAAPWAVMAPKAKGGNRLAAEMEMFGCDTVTTSRRHQRLCITTSPLTVNPDIQMRIETAIADGSPRLVGAMGLWSQPGIFSWDRIDPGTALLVSVLPPLTGRGADLGCGIGVLARAVLASTGVTHLELIDIDRRAIAAARRNVADPRAVFHWADARTAALAGSLDFIVMNPPFHDGGVEDRALGQAFVQRSHAMLRDGGTVWLVANRHLPYEAVLRAAFAQVKLQGTQGGFKVYEAIK
jgi:16S rRNA (guanine1207-N2)-methyltransferase